MGGFRVLDGQIAERVDGEEIGVFLDDVRDVHVGTKLGCGAKLLEVGEVLGGEIIHDRHGSAMKDARELYPLQRLAISNMKIQRVNLSFRRWLALTFLESKM